MSQFEQDILRRLSSAAAEPRAEFAASLKARLIEREQIVQIQTTDQHERNRFMNGKLIGLGLASVLVLVGVTSFIVGNGNNDAGRQTTQSTNQDTSNTSLESSLSTEPAGDVGNPLDEISFTPLQPTILLADETPSTMTTGSSNGPVDTSDTLYMDFVRGETTFYKIAQTTKQGNYPDDAEPVVVTVKGQPVQAWFYKVSDESDPSGRAPRSYLFMTVNGINVQISEFGAVTQEQLVKLANSLI